MALTSSLIRPAHCLPEPPYASIALAIARALPSFLLPGAILLLDRQNSTRRRDLAYSDHNNYSALFSTVRAIMYLSSPVITDTDARKAVQACINLTLRSTLVYKRNAGAWLHLRTQWAFRMLVC
jgi:hypothetical protein